MKVRGLLLVLAILFFPRAGSAQSQAPSVADIFTRAQPSVVVIFATGKDGKTDVLGSGFIVQPDRVVTNHHVLESMTDAVVVFSDGSMKPATGVAAESAEQDLIVLVVETGGRAPLSLGDELTLAQGDSVYAIGAPRGLELSLTNGIVSSFRNSNGQFLIQTTAAIAHGSSGGPLFNRAGRVVGITTSLLSDTPGIYFSIGVGDLKRLLRTPQLIVLPFGEWAKQNAKENARDSTAAQPEAAQPPEPNDVAQIEDLLKNKRFDEARGKIQAFTLKNADTPVAHRLTGELSLRTGDLEGALRDLNVSVTQDPKDAVARFYYALGLFEARKFQESLSQEEVSNQLAPSDADPPILALLYYSVGNFERAEAAARTALVSDAKNESALNVLAGLAYHGLSSRKENWSQYVLQLSKIDSDNFWFHISVGIAAYNQKQADQAIAAFLAAEKDDFPDAVPYIYLASMYKNRSEIGQANDQIKAGLTSVPGDQQLLSQGVFISLLARDNTEGGRRLDELGRLYPETKTHLFTACLYYYGIEQSTSALPYCARLTDQFPNDHTAHSNYGWAALDANQVQLAYQEFSKAYQLVASDWNKLTEVQVIDLMWGFTIASYYSGDKKDARKLLQTIRKSYPAAATVTGLQQTPLLWSATSMRRIEAILVEFPR